MQQCVKPGSERLASAADDQAEAMDSTDFYEFRQPENRKHGKEKVTTVCLFRHYSTINGTNSQTMMCTNNRDIKLIK